MLIDQLVLDNAWSKRIVANCLKRPSSSVQVFVAGDVDGLCACQILTHILALDGIPWDITPVRSYEDLVAALLSSFSFTRLSHSADSPATYVLINCGANVNLSEQLRLDEPQHDHLVLYVLDSHRPLHLHNVREDTERVVLLCSGNDPLPELEDEEDESSDEEKEDETAGAVARRRRRREVAQRNRAVLHEYYGVSYHSSPVSFLLYDLCLRLGRERPLVLWWAIVGLTDAMVHERIGMAAYDGLVTELNSSLQRTNVPNEQTEYYDNPLFPSALISSRSVSSPNAAPSSLAAPSRSSSSPPSSPSLLPFNPSPSSIPMPTRTAVGHMTFTPNEPRLLHLRHQPLYSSMQHSPYLSSHLRRWSGRGVGHIRTLLVELGIPLEKAKAAWREDEIDWRLREGMEELVDKHPRLRDMRMSSFLRQCGPTLTMSAVDAVYVAATLLEQDEDGLSIAAHPDSTNTATAAFPNKRIRVESDPSSSFSSSFSSSSSLAISAFWDAYTSISCSSLPLLHRGLFASCQLVALVNSTGLELMNKKLLLSRGPIRYALLHDGPNLSIIAHPLCLLRLAMFLFDCSHQQVEKRRVRGRAEAGTEEEEEGRKDGDKPVVVACLCPSRAVYMVVGVQSTVGVGGGAGGEVERNRLAYAFRRSAEGCGILDEIRHDSFDGNAMEVPPKHIAKFIEYLHTSVDL